MESAGERNERKGGINKEVGDEMSFELRKEKGEDRKNSRKKTNMRRHDVLRKKIHGDHIDEGDMFAAMHTRKGPLVGQLTWASPVSENFYYREAAKSQGKRVKRGYKIYGFGGHGRQLIKLKSSSRSRSLLLHHSFSQNSSDPDLEKEQLREEMSNIKEMMQQMQEREKKLEEQRQLQQLVQQMMGGQSQHQQRLSPNFMSYFPPSGMYIPHQQQNLQSFHQHFSGQTLPSLNGGTGGMLDLLLDPNNNFVGGSGGKGGVGARSGSGSDSGGV